MNKKKRLLRVFNAATGICELIEVEECVYLVYRRTNKAIDYNNKKFFKNECQFTALKGGDDGAFENFHEFISWDGPEQVDEKNQTLLNLAEALSLLSADELRLIEAIYFDGKSTSKYAREVNAPRETIRNRRNRILKLIRSFLDK
jgi:hypothetical protein